MASCFVLSIPWSVNFTKDLKNIVKVSCLYGQTFAPFKVIEFIFLNKAFDFDLKMTTRKQKG